jgi:phenylalanyl-tRNA synthetase beta chain
LNPINNIVDLTNFIMAELAQPMHAFDREKLSGDTIVARPAREGERILALNEEEYVLSPSNLVIADAAGPIAIAGVIGGHDSAISERTTTIVLESANFQASSVRKTSSMLKLRTDASMRFEKSQDPHTTVRALARAMELLPQISPGIRVVGGLADCGSRWHEPAPVLLDLNWLARKLGRALEPDRVRQILSSLEFGVSDLDSHTLSVTVPSWRATKDVAMPEDLVEEVGRMIGYDSIEPQPPLVLCSPAPDPPERAFLRGIKRAIAAQGFTEVSNYSFTSEEDVRRLGLPAGDHVRVLNPIAAGQELMRTSLLPGIHRNIVENAKHFDQFRLFEVGREIHKQSEGQPEERTHLMAAVFAKDDGRAGLLELKRSTEPIVPALSVRPAPPLAWEHPARCATVWSHHTLVGRLSELHPSLVDAGRAAVIDIDLDRLFDLNQDGIKYRPVRRFPTSAFDLSVIADARDLAGELEARIKAFAGEFTEAVEYVREYQGAPVPEGRKSVTFRITAGAPDRTLTSEDITAIRIRILSGLDELGYDTRV